MKLPVGSRKVTEVSHKIVDAPKPIIEKLFNPRKNAFGRFPLLFTFLGGFGLVATFYGFERLIDKIDLLSRNPFILLATGVLILILTGTLYKKL
ncbi:hypothetical protein A3F65_03060 [Candidatus Saccharibacteria bacterium RIFCSPHIGHO2_12_FULL_47_16b]|nr:MAG: hypothetical protein A3F65_03060 [Candidatus Saccharibacteria bacterium RIFCSPHIGHO2_12_FULL_47_16b]